MIIQLLTIAQTHAENAESEEEKDINAKIASRLGTNTGVPVSFTTSFSNV